MKKISNIQCALTVCFVSCLLISNTIGAKQISMPYGISVTAAVITFPITYILSDLFSEVYGYKWSRITCWMAFTLNAFMVFIFFVAIKIKPADGWANQEAFQTILGSTFRVSAASLIGYVAGDFVNDRIFRAMKKGNADMKGYCARAIVSSVFGELVDSTAFMTLAFAGTMPASTMVKSILFYVAMKCAYEAIILPVNKLITAKVKEYESRD